MVNKYRNPYTNNIDLFISMSDLGIIPAHVKIFTLVGILITKVAVVKYLRVSISILIVNIWCAHTMAPNTPIDLIDHSIL